MILSLVSELFARVAQQPAVEEAFETLRSRAGEVSLAGLTDSAKALLAPLAVAELGRPTILLVESNQRAETLLEPARYFYRATTGKPGHRVAHLPAYDVLPYEGRSPHAEISEDRAVALWRFAVGDADLLIVPVQAALWRWREREFYSHLARTIQRDDSIPHEELIEFLTAAGYEKQVTCETPGQFAVRGGIIDIFSPESPQPVRVELLGDMIESIRAFDPATQRSTNPVERAALLPLTEFPLRIESLERLHVPFASGREDDSAPAGFYPGLEFRGVPFEDRHSALFELAAEPLVIL
jgi:transcription-repair coupling factor (superfamily II helicase)